MKECFCLLLFILHFTEGCHISDFRQSKEVTSYIGGSVLLPCSCHDPQSKAQTIRWSYSIENKWTEVFKDEKYKDRVKLFNQRSPANLSLLISDLSKEDEGAYMCQTSQTYTYIRITIKGCDLDQNKQTLEVTGHSEQSVVLSCSCTELLAKPQQFTWTFTALKPRGKPEELYPDEQSERHRGRVKLLSEGSPGNLSLHISDLKKEDQGEYQCSVPTGQHTITLTVKEKHYFHSACLSTNKPAKLSEEQTTREKKT
ncbi:polymeric immunoglobulin receptor-like isoform X2 [Danio rerio]|uniref:polymeric immunoglobulin receptor-like isoform X2 n=1 Tax=Danio rerio TaxID=7955 RepID=UPI003CE4499F